MMENDIYKTAGDCARETKMSRIRGELNRANKRADEMLTRLETISIGLLGHETVSMASQNTGTMDVKVSLDPGSLVVLIDWLGDLHNVMSRIEHQIDRISSDL